MNSYVSTPYGDMSRKWKKEELERVLTELEAAYALLNDGDSWVQGVNVRVNEDDCITGYCSVGAIQEVTGNGQEYYDVLLRFNQAMGQNFLVSTWNDDHGWEIIKKGWEKVIAETREELNALG